MKDAQNVCIISHSHTDGYVFDGAAVAAGDQLRSEVLAADAVDLSSFCAHKEALAFPAERYGGHRLLQLRLSGENGGRGPRTFWVFLYICAAAANLESTLSVVMSPKPS